MKKLLSAALAVSLCAGLAFAGPVIAESTETEVQAEAAAGGHVENLVVGTTSAIETRSILSQSGSFGKFNYNSIVYANFFYPDENGDMQPYFLDSYEISGDGCELKLTFPTTAVWHDGEPVTAEDVAFTFEFRRDVMGVSSLANLTEARIDSEDTVTLVFSEPDAYYLVANSNLTLFVIPKHIWEKVDDYESYAEEDAAIGCGPYKLVNVDEDAGTLYYEAVPENAFLGELTVDSITLKSYSTQDALLMALSNGEVDVMYDYATPVSYTLLDVIDGNEDVDKGASDYKGCNQVTFGMSQGANLEHAFREAAVKSLDWELITQLCNGEYGEIPGSGIIPPANRGCDESLWKFYQDTEEAETLLDEAGFVDADGDGWRDMPDGAAFTYKVVSQYTTKKQELFNRIGEVLVSGLQGVGINAYYDQESLASQEANDKMREENDFDMYIGYTTTGVAGYRTAYWYFVSSDVPGAGGDYGHGNSYHDEDLNNAYTKLIKATNDTEYLEAVKELQTLGSEDLFAFALCWEKCFFPYRTDKYQGFEDYPSIGVVHAKTFYELTTK
ncbi:MAG: ABC transporter substrate-binding protein [Candidatus Limivivens sp.]|nr:ABC transporter substrate-binding protein [Candidatus Limivivens sp.]